MNTVAPTSFPFAGAMNTNMVNTRLADRYRKMRDILAGITERDATIDRAFLQSFVDIQADIDDGELSSCSSAVQWARATVRLDDDFNDLLPVGSRRPVWNVPHSEIVGWDPDPRDDTGLDFVPGL